MQDSCRLIASGIYVSDDVGRVVRLAVYVESGAGWFGIWFEFSGV